MRITIPNEPPPPVHARGFPHFGPATICGKGSAPMEPVSEVTCPACLKILSKEGGLVRRIADLEASGAKVDLAARRDCPCCTPYPLAPHALKKKARF
jgi:hypothetical protein